MNICQLTIKFLRSKIVIPFYRFNYFMNRKEMRQNIINILTIFYGTLKIILYTNIKVSRMNKYILKNQFQKLHRLWSANSSAASWIFVFELQCNDELYGKLNYGHVIWSVYGSHAKMLIENCYFYSCFSAHTAWFDTYIVII